MLYRDESNVANVKHAVLCELVNMNGRFLLSFMSGEGRLFNKDGMPTNPLLFAVTLDFEKEPSEVVENFEAMLTNWMNRDLSIDISIEDKRTILSCPEVDEIIRIGHP